MKLIIINGPSGVGKTTLARALHKQMPLCFLLDIDAQTRFISHFEDYREERWQMNLALSTASIEACMKIGRDVIVDKMLYDERILDAFRNIGEKYKAEVHELMIWAEKQEVIRRSDKRGYQKDGVFTPETCVTYWEKVTALKDRRPQAHIVDVTNISAEGVLAYVKDLVGVK